MATKGSHPRPRPRTGRGHSEKKPSKRKDNSLYTSQINAICRQLDIPSYRGAYSYEVIPHMGLENNDFCCIMNTDEVSDNGEHWIALVGRKGTIYHFDPFGLPCINRLIQCWMRDSFKTVKMNDFPIQDHSDTTLTSCGYHCILYIYYKMLTNISFHDFAKLYPLQGTNFAKNEAFAPYEVRVLLVVEDW